MKPIPPPEEKEVRKFPQCCTTSFSSSSSSFPQGGEVRKSFLIVPLPPPPPPPSVSHETRKGGRRVVVVGRLREREQLRHPCIHSLLFSLFILLCAYLPPLFRKREKWTNKRSPPPPPPKRRRKWRAGPGKMPLLDSPHPASLPRRLKWPGKKALVWDSPFFNKQ